MRMIKYHINYLIWKNREGKDAKLVPFTRSKDNIDEWRLNGKKNLKQRQKFSTFVAVNTNFVFFQYPAPFAATNVKYNLNLQGL